jgi:release factor glutamine methyltransferase
VTQTAKQLLEWGIARLKPILGDAAATDVRVLLAHAMGVERGLLGAKLLDRISPEQITTFKAVIAQRENRQPVAQIIGVREFWGRSFVVTPDVLDPRPDTETLIEEVLKGDTPSRVLDMGTGSGCILLTLLAEWPNAQGQGVDQSVPALKVAKQNAKLLGVMDRVDLKQSDWFSNVTGKFDIIVSNPPYISADEMEVIAPEVRNWEPRIALTPEGDGLDAYRKIASKAARFLTPNGRIFLEIGWDQAKSVIAIFNGADFTNVYCIRDLNGKDRVLVFNAVKKL